jgi:hypothetical protein
VKSSTRISGFFLALAIAAFTRPASAQIGVASNQPASASQANAVSNTVLEAQTFIPTATGPVFAVDLALSKLNAASNLTLQIHTADEPSGLPGAISLASVTLTPAQVTDSAFSPLTYTTFNFASSGLTLTAGTQYSLVLASDSSDSQYSVYASGNTYPDGEDFGSTNTGATFLPYGGTRPSTLDWTFQVREVPEPSLTALAAASILILHRRRRAIAR